MRLAERPQAGEVRAGHCLLRVDLHGQAQATVPLDEHVDLGPAVGPPVVQAGLRFTVVEEAGALEHHPLLEEPAAPDRIGRRPESAVQAVRDPGVEQGEARVADEPRARAGAPRFEPAADQGVLEDLVVLLHRAGSERRVASHRRGVDDPAVLGRHHVEEARKAAQVADQRFGLHLLALLPKCRTFWR